MSNQASRNASRCAQAVASAHPVGQLNRGDLAHLVPRASTTTFAVAPSASAPERAVVSDTVAPSSSSSSGALTAVGTDAGQSIVPLQLSDAEIASMLGDAATEAESMLRQAASAMSDAQDGHSSGVSGNGASDLSGVVPSQPVCADAPISSSAAVPLASFSAANDPLISFSAVTDVTGDNNHDQQSTPQTSVVVVSAPPTSPCRDSQSTPAGPAFGVSGGHGSDRADSVTPLPHGPNGWSIYSATSRVVYDRCSRGRLGSLPNSPTFGRPSPYHGQTSPTPSSRGNFLGLGSPTSVGSLLPSWTPTADRSSSSDL